MSMRRWVRGRWFLLAIAGCNSGGSSTADIGSTSTSTGADGSTLVTSTTDGTSSSVPDSPSTSGGDTESTSTGSSGSTAATEDPTTGANDSSTSAPTSDTETTTTATTSTESTSSTESSSSTSTESSTGEPIEPPDEIEILYERPAGAFFENLARTEDGSILITAHTDQQILRMTPQGAVDVFADMDAWPFGIAIDTDGTVVIAAQHSEIFDLAVPFESTNAIYIADGNGGADLLTEVPQAVFLNGMTLLSPGVMLAADSTAATIWRIEVATGDVLAWLEHPLLARAMGSALPGANGIKLYEGAIYVSNSDGGTIIRVPVAGDGTAGVAAIHFTGALVDDFAFGASGTIYATTHGNDVFRILPNLTTQNVAGLADGVEGNTAVVFGGTALDDEAIYVSTDGGLFLNDGNVNQSGPARIVRIPVGEPEG